MQLRRSEWLTRKLFAYLINVVDIDMRVGEEVREVPRRVAGEMGEKRKHQRRLGNIHRIGGSRNLAKNQLTSTQSARQNGSGTT